MPSREPDWWYGQEQTVIARMLRPLGALYGAASEYRIRRGTPHKSAVPVICIGNFTAGGTGKTPLTLLLAEMLLARGAEPVALSRGYGGRVREPHWVDPAHDQAGRVGDEPLLLARAMPTLVARDRHQGALAIAARATARTIILMDDGMQNSALAKDLVIAVVDGRRGFGNGWVIPAGPLRATLAFQMTLADAILVNGAPAANASGEPIFERLAREFPGPVLAATVAAQGDATWLAEKPLAAFAGIGAPERFFDLVESLGGRIAIRRAFPDHHVFTAADAEALLAAATATGARLVTTEKDLARLAGQPGVLGDLASQTTVLAITLALPSGDRTRLQSLLDAVVQSTNVKPSATKPDTKPDAG